MTVWIVADVKSEDGVNWELAGVFDSREKAVASCTRWNHCIWPMKMNVMSPDETTVHPQAEYPIPRTA